MLVPGRTGIYRSGEAQPRRGPFTLVIGKAMKRRDLIKRLAAPCALVAMPSLAALAPPNRIVLGQSAAFTGNAAQLGIQMNIGARIFFNALNAAGGVNGNTVELRTLDDGYEPERCKVNTEQFIKDDVFGLFGYVGTPTSLAALPLVVDAKVPFFGPFTGAEALRDPFHRSVFHLRASYFDETRLIVNNLTQLGLKKIAVFYQNDAYGKAGLEGVTRALKAQDLAPVALGTVERNSIDVASAVKDITPKMPDAVVQISAYKSCAAFIRGARKAGYGGTFLNVSFVGTQALADELDHHADLTRVPQCRAQGRRRRRAELFEHGRLSGRQGVRRRPEARRPQPDARSADQRPGGDPASKLRRLQRQLRAEGPRGLALRRPVDADRRRQGTPLDGCRAARRSTAPKTPGGCAAKVRQVNCFHYELTGRKHASLSRAVPRSPPCA
jgi:ABC-type branched-subunit amino acid transport system substrate-binding protein